MVRVSHHQTVDSIVVLYNAPESETFIQTLRAVIGFLGAEANSLSAELAQPRYCKCKRISPDSLPLPERMNRDAI
jgi:hypothetical protein